MPTKTKDLEKVSLKELNKSLAEMKREKDGIVQKRDALNEEAQAKLQEAATLTKKAKELTGLIREAEELKEEMFVGTNTEKEALTWGKIDMESVRPKLNLEDRSLSLVGEKLL